MANTAKAQAIFKGMTPEQQQVFLNKQKTASAGDQAKVSAALKPIKPVVSTPAATTPVAPTSTVPPSNTPPINTPPVEPVQDNTVGPADPVTPQIDKAKVAWAKMNGEQQQEFATKHNFDPKKYGLEFAKGSTKPQQSIGQNNQTTPPAATTPEAPAPVESTQPNYQDNSTARLQEIRNNLDQQLQAAPSLFNDRPAFDATFNYALRSKEQQAVLNNFWYQKSQSDLFNNTPTDVLANSIASNQTSIDAFSFMKDKEPLKYAALQAAVTEANKREALKASLDPKKFLEDFNKRYDESIARIDEQQALINTEELLPAITKSKEELAGLKSEIDQIELDKAKIEAEVLAEYEGKGISKGLLNEIINDRQQTLIDQGNSKILQYNSKLGGLNAKMDEMKMYNDLEKERTDMDRQMLVDTLSTYQTLSGVFNQYVNQEMAQEELDLKEYPATEDKNIGKTVDLGTAKAPKVMMWNPETQSYDIPLSGGGGYYSGGTGTGGGSGGGSYSGTTPGSDTSVYEDLNAITGLVFKNVDQSKNFGFAQNGILANEELNNLEQDIKGVSPAKLQIERALPQILQSDLMKKYEQAERNFINTVGRKESGAQISQDEWTNYRLQYGPQPGDSDDLLRTKRLNRQIAIKSAIESSGPSAASELTPILVKSSRERPQTTTSTVGGTTYTKKTAAQAKLEALKAEAKGEIPVSAKKSLAQSFMDLFD